MHAKAPPKAQIRANFLLGCTPNSPHPEGLVIPRWLELPTRPRPAACMTYIQRERARVETRNGPARPESSGAAVLERGRLGRTVEHPSSTRGE
jgi:hypothetical protein